MSVLVLTSFGQCGAGAQGNPGPGEDLGLDFWSWESISIEALTSTDIGVRNAAYAALEDFQAKGIAWSANLTRFVIGCRVYRETATDFCALVRIGDVGQLMIDASGYPVWSYDSLYRSTVNVLQGSVALAEDEWTYVEVEIDVSYTSGTCRIYVEGTLTDEWTSQQTARTAAPDAKSYEIGMYSSSYSHWAAGWKITDLYIDDDEVRGISQAPYQPTDEAGSAAGFTPSAGSNHQNVDDLGNDGDSTYNESSATGTKDSLGHGTTHVLAPVAVMPVACVRSFSGEAAGVQVGILSDSTEDLCATQQTNEENWGWMKGDMYETDPATASAWDVDGIDAAETVIKHVAKL